jgi:heat shock protein HtpX
VLYLVTLVVYFFGTLLVRMLSRHREYLADHAGAELSGNPRALASALEKINAAAQEVPKEQVAKLSTASALCLMPAYGKSDIASLFSTHPPFKDRVKRLLELEKTKQIDYRYRWDKK